MEPVHVKTQTEPGVSPRASQTHCTAEADPQLEPTCCSWSQTPSYSFHLKRHLSLELETSDGSLVEDGTAKTWSGVGRDGNLPDAFDLSDAVVRDSGQRRDHL